MTTWHRDRKPNPSGVKRVRMAVVSTAIVFMLAAVILNMQIGFAVSVNGQNLGATQTKAQADEIIENVERQAAEILGYDEYTIADSVTVSAGLVPEKSGAAELESSLLESIEGISRRWAVTADGVICVSSDSREELEGLLASLLEESRTPDTLSLTFAGSVAVEYLFLRDDTPSDPDAVRAILAEESLNPDSPLAVVRTEDVTRTKAIPYDTEYRDTDRLYIGETEVLTEGVNGSQRITERVVTVGGQEVERTELLSFVTAKPQTETVLTGTKEIPPTASCGAFIWPTQGVLTSYFGPRNAGIGSTNHKGIDIGGPYGQDIVAADGGEVVFAEFTSNGYGNLVKILHDDGTVTYYGHCSALLVSAGERVAQGQVIAQIGSTGISSGAHLHFEVRPGGDFAENAIDPLTVLP